MWTRTTHRRLPWAAVALAAGCTHEAAVKPIGSPPPVHADSGQQQTSHDDDDSGTSDDPPEDTAAPVDPPDPDACEQNAITYVGHDESVVFNSFAWMSPDDGGIIVRAAITTSDGLTACEMFSTDPSPYEAQPLVVNIWAGEGNELGAFPVTMEEAKEEATPPPGDPNEPDGLGADAVVRLSSGERLRSGSYGQVFNILYYGPEAPLMVDDGFQATFNDGSELLAGGWVACHCPDMLAFGSE